MADPTQRLADFLSEAQEVVDLLGRDLLRLEGHGEPDPDLLNAIFRGAHTLKGLASMFAVERMARLSMLVGLGAGVYFATLWTLGFRLGDFKRRAA